MKVATIMSPLPICVDGEATLAKVVELMDELDTRHIPVTENEELAGMNTRLEFGNGVPGVEILDKARREEVDLAVLATHGWTGVRRFFLGSVAETLVRKLPCSALTVRSPITD